MTRRVLTLLLAVLVVALGAWEVRRDVDGLDLLHGLRLGALVGHVEPLRGAVVFGTVGTIGPSGYIGALSYGRPPTLLDRYLRLRIDGLDVVDDHSCVPAVRFLRQAGPARRGLWVFYSPEAGERARGKAAVGGREVPGGYVVVESPSRSPRALLEEGLRLRRAWHRAVPRDVKVDYFVRADETALRAPARCEPLGEFGNPDITPARRIPPPD